MIKYRKMKLSDLFTVGELERRIFKDPWSVNSCRGAVENPCVYAVVAEDEDGIAGYGFMMGTQDEAEILRVAVIPEKRRQHIGSDLLEDMLDHGDYEGYTNVFLEVRESNIVRIIIVTPRKTPLSWNLYMWKRKSDPDFYEMKYRCCR